MQIGPEHVMATGALPPGVPPILIDGEHYRDGGIISNSLMTYIFDERPMHTALIIQVNLFNAHGPMPQTLDEAMARVKEIQYFEQAAAQ
jgi:NTE family protein